MYDVTDAQIEQYFEANPEWRDMYDLDNPVHVQRIASEIHQDEAEAKLTVPACPSWCELGEGHKYDSVEKDNETFVRYHSTAQDEAVVLITQMESNRGNVVTLSPVKISIWTTEGDRMDSAQALDLSDVLRMAASQLDEITSK